MWDIAVAGGNGSCCVAHHAAMDALVAMLRKTEAALREQLAGWDAEKEAAYVAAEAAVLERQKALEQGACPVPADALPRRSPL